MHIQSREEIENVKPLEKHLSRVIIGDGAAISLINFCASMESSS